MEELEARLKELIIEKYGSLKKFSEAINMPWTTLDSILKRGVANSNISNVLKITKELGINAEKLVEGTITKNAAPPIAMAAHFDGNEYTEDELEDIRNYAEFIRHKRNEAQQSKLTQLPDRSYLEPVAAHNRTDISDDSRTDELKNLEASIMDNEDEWK